MIHHVLERVGEEELAAFAGGTLQHVFDAVEQRAPILHVLQPDVGPLGDRRIRLLHDLRHVALLVRHHDAEALVVLDLFGPDDTVSLCVFHDRQVGVEQRVHEDDDHGSVHVRAREIYRARRPVEHLLLDEARRNVVVLPHVRFDFLLQMARDDDQLLELPGSLERVHHVIHHRPARDIHERLGNALGQRQEASAFARHRHDHFHLGGTRP